MTCLEPQGCGGGTWTRTQASFLTTIPSSHREPGQVTFGLPSNKIETLSHASFQQESLAAVLFSKEETELRG